MLSRIAMRYYRTLSNIKDKSNLENIGRYTRVNLVQAPLEALLVVVLAEGFMIYSKFFDGELSNFNLSIVLLLPIVLSTFICLIFTMVISNKVVSKISHFIHKKIVPFETCDDFDAAGTYIEAQNAFKKVFFRIHIAGVLCYSFNSLLVVLVLFNLPGVRFAKDFYGILLVLFGVGFGLLWNIRGYWGDQRVHWGKMFNSLQSVKLHEVSINHKQYKTMQELKFSYTVKHILINILSIALLVLCFLFIVINPKNQAGMHKIDFGELVLTSQGFFIFVFITLFFFYIKTLFPLFYSGKTGIYPEANDLISSKSSNNE